MIESDYLYKFWQMGYPNGQEDQIFVTQIDIIYI